MHMPPDGCHCIYRVLLSISIQSSILGVMRMVAECGNCYLHKRPRSTRLARKTLSLSTNHKHHDSEFPSSTAFCQQGPWDGEYSVQHPATAQRCCKAHQCLPRSIHTSSPKVGHHSLILQPCTQLSIPSSSYPYRFFVICMPESYRHIPVRGQHQCSTLSK